MDIQMSMKLDRYITGNYGEDQIDQDDLSDDQMSLDYPIKEMVREDFYSETGDFDLSKSNIRAGLLRAGVNAKDIEKRYIKDMNLTLR